MPAGDSQQRVYRRLQAPYVRVPLAQLRPGWRTCLSWNEFSVQIVARRSCICVHSLSVHGQVCEGVCSIMLPVSQRRTQYGTLMLSTDAQHVSSRHGCTAMHTCDAWSPKIALSRTEHLAESWGDMQNASSDRSAVCTKSKSGCYGRPTAIVCGGLAGPSMTDRCDSWPCTE